jgi:folylpolyglutamate synthase
MLGSTLPEIAWHKSGIFKPGSIAFTAPQKEEALTVLQQRAAEKNTTLHVIDVHPALANNEVKLGLSASFQKVNASVAIAVAAAHLRKLGHNSVPDPTSSSHISLPAEFIRGLEKVRWPGRCEVRREPGVAWYIDGGHTLDSIEMTGRWFAEQIVASRGAHASSRRILIFNQQTRDANELVKALHKALLAGLKAGKTDVSNVFSHVIFCTNKTYATGFKPDLVSMNTNQADVDELSVQKALGSAWKEIDPSASVTIRSSIEEAIQVARDQARSWKEESGETAPTDYETPVLITGSLHLVGGAIDVLEN